MTAYRIAICGWKNSGKTTLVERLVAELSARGLAVSTLKHAHHSFDLDQAGSDTSRHRTAGAREVAIISQRRWAILHENADDEAEAGFEAVAARMSDCDILLVEGYKSAAIPKIEIQRAGANSLEPLHGNDTNVIALVDPQAPPLRDLPVFSADAIAELADFIEAQRARSGTAT